MELGEEAPIEIEIVRSGGRVKTAGARWLQAGRKVEIRLPAGMNTAEEQRVIDKLMAKMRAAARRQQLNDDINLPERAAALNRRYFGGKLKVDSIEWVTNQRHRYGSCTPALHAIRISDRVARMPAWVQDYVLVHELAHLIEGNHSPAFWQLVARYPFAERARGYLIALGLEGMDGPAEE